LPLTSWAHEILDSMTGICELLDHGNPQRPYTVALKAQQEKIADVERTPSARLLKELSTSGETFFELARRVSTNHRDYFRSLPAPGDGRLQNFEREAAESLAKQASIEAARAGSFDAYLANYFAKA
jgi:glutamate--cysteine ligase